MSILKQLADSVLVDLAALFISVWALLASRRAASAAERQADAAEKQKELMERQLQLALEQDPAVRQPRLDCSWSISGETMMLRVMNPGKLVVRLNRVDVVVQWPGPDDAARDAAFQWSAEPRDVPPSASILVPLSGGHAVNWHRVKAVTVNYNALDIRGNAFTSKVFAEPTQAEGESV